MRSAELQRLLSDLQGNATLRGELERRAKDLDQLVGLANAHGYRLTREEAAELSESWQELSDEDLDRAAGGAWNDPPTPPPSGGTGG